MVAHINEEAAEIRKIGSGHSSSGSGSSSFQVGDKTVTRETVGDYGVDDDEFEAFNRKIREDIERSKGK